MTMEDFNTTLAAAEASSAIAVSNARQSGVEEGKIWLPVIQLPTGWYPRWTRQMQSLGPQPMVSNQF